MTPTRLTGSGGQVESAVVGPLGHRGRRVLPIQGQGAAGVRQVVERVEGSLEHLTGTVEVVAVLEAGDPPRHVLDLADQHRG